MKKLISLFIALSMLILALSSCGQQAAPSASVTVPSESAPTEAATSDGASSSSEPTGEPAPSESATTEPTETTGGTNIDDPKEFVPTGYSFSPDTGMTTFVETNSKIIFLGVYSVAGNKAGVYYYSKAAGEFYPFCFDPLCQHQRIWDGEKYIGTTCVARMLEVINGARTDTLNPPLYINGRIYFTFFDEIWSCNEYATDIRIDVSFSKLPSDFTRTDARKRVNGNITYFPIFISGGNSIYLEHLDADGVVRNYRLDTETRKLHDLSEEMEALAKDLGLESLVFQYAVGKYIRFGGINPNTKKTEYVVTDQNLNITSIPFLGENDTLSIIQLCTIGRRNEKGNRISREKIEVFPNGEYKLIDIERNASYATNNYLYYPGGESVFLGYGSYVSIVTGEAEKIINSANGIVRYNRKTGEEELLFQDDLLHCNRILYVNEETGEFISLATQYKKYTDGTFGATSNNIYIGKLVDGKLEDFHHAQFEEVEEPDHPIIPGVDW